MLIIIKFTDLICGQYLVLLAHPYLKMYSVPLPRWNFDNIEDIFTFLIGHVDNVSILKSLSYVVYF